MSYLKKYSPIKQSNFYTLFKARGPPKVSQSLKHGMLFPIGQLKAQTQIRSNTLVKLSGAQQLKIEGICTKNRKNGGKIAPSTYMKLVDSKPK